MDCRFRSAAVFLSSFSNESLFIYMTPCIYVDLIDLNVPVPARLLKIFFLNIQTIKHVYIGATTNNADSGEVVCLIGSPDHAPRSSLAWRIGGIYLFDEVYIYQLSLSYICDSLCMYSYFCVRFVVIQSGTFTRCSPFHVLCWTRIHG